MGKKGNLTFIWLDVNGKCQTSTVLMLNVLKVLT